MGELLMTWIKTVPPTPDNAPLLEALEKQAVLYPQEYHPAHREARRVPEMVKNDSIVLSHSLIPQALHHAFATFGVLTDPALPLSRRQQEMIATTVSALNRCFY
jgi:hypothetical protein